MYVFVHPSDCFLNKPKTKKANFSSEIRRVLKALRPPPYSISVSPQKKSSLTVLKGLRRVLAYIYENSACPTVC